jgi:hypothetical protein
MAAILRATVTRASSGRSPRASNSPCQDLKGSHREAVSAALLKTYFNVRLWFAVSPRVIGGLALRRSPAPTAIWSALDFVTTASPQYDQNRRLPRKRCGVTTAAISCPMRTMPSVGTFNSTLHAGWRRHSATRALRASRRRLARWSSSE